MVLFLGTTFFFIDRGVLLLDMSTHFDLIFELLALSILIDDEYSMLLLFTILLLREEHDFIVEFVKFKWLLWMRVEANSSRLK